MAQTSKEEQYEEWLDRLDIDVTDVQTQEDLRGALLSQLGLDFNDAQIQALFSQLGIHRDLADAGIHISSMKRDWGVEYRYGIQGLPGFWGWKKVREVMISEGWWE